MAWRSSGTTNDEMVDALKRYDVITSMDVETAFRQVDRGHFVPQTQLQLAYSDQPLRKDNIHISAPHIYGSVLELMDLSPNTTLKVLYAGSGTGYFMSLMAAMLGPRSTHYCIEIHQDVVQHCNESIARWKEHVPEARAIQDIHIIHGDALQISREKGEASFGFDRIYIGAAIDNDYLLEIRNLLKPGGILVGPVDDELVKLTRTQNWVDPSSVVPPKPSDFKKVILSCVRFAPMTTSEDAKEVVIPARIWQPSLHQYYPESFKKSCRQLMMCANSNAIQPVIPKPQPKEKVNVSAVLPKAIWIEILSYTHKDWFQTPHTEVEILRQQLEQEKEKAKKANEARLAAQTKLQQVTRERDVFRTLAKRWQSRLSAESQNQSLHDDLMDDEDFMDMVTILQGRFTSFGDIMVRLGSARSAHHDGHFSDDSEDDEDDSDDDDGEDDEDNDENSNGDDDAISYVRANDEDDEAQSIDQDDDGDDGENENNDEEDDDDDGDERMEHSLHETETHGAVNMEAEDDDMTSVMSDDDDYPTVSHHASKPNDRKGISMSTGQGMKVSSARHQASARRHQIRAVSFCGGEG